jgi:lysine 2,3-aminomutase
MDRKVGPEHFRSIPLWSEVTDEQWNDWQWQLKNRVTTHDALNKIITLIPEELEAIKTARGRLSMAITPYWATLMDPINPFCPLRRQAVPISAEFDTDEHEMVDPCGEDKDSPVPGVVHRYPDRVLLLATENCAMYCRHCTRRRLVKDAPCNFSKDRFEKIYEYLKSNKKIRDVLISGGDPFMLPDEKLEDILKNVQALSHIEFLRIGTRVPVTLPQRITESFVAMLKKYSPL